MSDKEERRSVLEESLIRAMGAIDNQIAREMLRSPSEREAHGVQKWEPYNKRIELITSTILNALGDGEIQLDSLLVMAQAMSKALLLVTEDLGAEGLGKIRSTYAVHAMETMSNDSHRALQVLKGTDGDLN